MNRPINKWTKTIAERLSDKWDGKSGFPEDAELLKEVIEKALNTVPDDLMNVCDSLELE